MKKTIIAILFTLLMVTPVFAETSVETALNQEIKNDNSYLGVNFEKLPTNKDGKQLISNNKSFLIFNVIINGKIKPNTTEE